jgi:uncharacterized metal-binding protein
VSSGGNDGARTLFRYVLARYVMEISKGYVQQEFLTEAARSEVVHKVVEKIIGHHQEQIPETEKSMEKYICENQQNIKSCLKVHTLKILGHRNMKKLTITVLSVFCYRDMWKSIGDQVCVSMARHVQEQHQINVLNSQHGIEMVSSL